jgi:hypothetical protein
LHYTDQEVNLSLADVELWVGGHLLQGVHKHRGTEHSRSVSAPDQYSTTSHLPKHYSSVCCKHDLHMCWVYAGACNPCQTWQALNGC